MWAIKHIPNLFTTDQTFLMSTSVCAKHRARYRSYKSEQDKTWTFYYFTSGSATYNRKTQTNESAFLSHGREVPSSGCGGGFLLFYLSALLCQLQGFLLKVTSWPKRTAGAPAMAPTLHSAGTKGQRKGYTTPPTQGGLLEAHRMLFLKKYIF